MCVCVHIRQNDASALFNWKHTHTPLQSFIKLTASWGPASGKAQRFGPCVTMWHFYVTRHHLHLINHSACSPETSPCCSLFIKCTCCTSRIHCRAALLCLWGHVDQPLCLLRNPSCGRPCQLRLWAHPSQGDEVIILSSISLFMFLNTCIYVFITLMPYLWQSHWQPINSARIILQDIWIMLLWHKSSMAYNSH